MIELFDKKFVHFMWDDKLEGKKCFVKDCIDELADIVEKGGSDASQEVERSVSDTMQEVRYSGKPYSPFHIFSDGEHYDFVFAYYDPNYSIKKAFNEGKTIQLQIGESCWKDISSCSDLLFVCNTGGVLRIKPEEEKWIAYLTRPKNRACFLDACREDDWEIVQQEEYGAKTKLFVGIHDEVEKWYESRQKFAEVIKAWEDGKELQFRPRDPHLSWQECGNPSWDVDLEYREVKPYWTKRIKNLFPPDYAAKQEEVFGAAVWENFDGMEWGTLVRPLCQLRKAYTSQRLTAKIKKIQIVNGANTDLKINKPVYAIHLCDVKKGGKNDRR